MKIESKYNTSLLNRETNYISVLTFYKIILTILIIGWTGIISFFFVWKLSDLIEIKTDTLLNQAKLFASKEINNKGWNATHKYLSTNPDTIELIDNQYISTREDREENLRQRIIVRLIGINPQKEINPPDKIEKTAIASFKKGKNEFYTYNKINNQEFFYYARALKIKKDCLLCHNNENKEGDLIGLLSIKISSNGIDNFFKSNLKKDIAIYSIIWISGLLVFLFLFSKLYLHIKELKLSREQFYEFLDNSPMSTFIKDGSGNLIYMNKIAEQYLPEKFRNGKWKGLKDTDIWDKNITDKLREHDLEVLINMKPKVFEETIESDGKKYFWLTHKFPIKDNSNNNIYIVGIEIDITERKEKEKEIKKYTKQLEELNKSKDKFISVLAHDLRGPFTPILGYTELLATSAEYLTYQEIKEYAHSLDIIVKNQYQLLENILDWTRLESGRLKIEPKELNLFDEVKKVINLYQPILNDKELKVIEKVDPAYEIITDQHLLNTILRNLISNAIKYSNRKGTIQINASEENNGYKIQVIDSGIGIAEENLSKIFGGEKGFTTRGTANEKGTGLGLSICKEMVERLGGKIWVESHPGKGSTFSFIIPNMSTTIT